MDQEKQAIGARLRLQEVEVTAEYRDGVLVINLPKTEKAQTRMIDDMS